MRTFLVAFGLSLLLSLVWTRVVRDLAIRWGLFDTGGGRKIHTRPIPRLGGVAVILSALLPLVGMVIWENKVSRALLADHSLLQALLGGSAVMIVVGLIDDLKGSRAWVKLLAQITAALIVYNAGIRIEGISVPFVGVLPFDWIALPATVFWIVLVMNAINLIDGLDGLAGGVVVLAGGTLFVMSVVEDNILAALLLAVVVGATLGFLAYNLNPASIFLGDTGSLWLGFVLALTSVHSSQKSYTLFSIVAALLALGLPIFDLSMAVVRRYLSGQPIFGADQHHVHHILLRKGFTQTQSAVALFLAAVVLEGAALLFIYANDAVSALVIALLLPLLVLAVRLLGYTELIRSARRAKVMVSLEDDAARKLDNIARARGAFLVAGDPDTLWAELVALGQALHLETVSLELVDAAPRAWRRSDGVREVHHRELVELQLPLRQGARVLGHLEVAWWREKEPFEPLTRASMQVVADGLANGLAALPQGWPRVAGSSP